MEQINYTVEGNDKFVTVKTHHGIDKFFKVIKVIHNYQTTLSLFQLYKKYNADIILEVEGKYVILDLIKDAQIIN